METDQVCNEYLPVIYLSAKEGNELKQWNLNCIAEIRKCVFSRVQYTYNIWDHQLGFKINVIFWTLLNWCLKVVIVLAILNVFKHSREEEKGTGMDDRHYSWLSMTYLWMLSKMADHAIPWLKTKCFTVPDPQNNGFKCTQDSEAVSQHLYIALWEHNVPGKLVWYKCLT